MLEPLPSDRDAQHHSCRACDDLTDIQDQFLWQAFRIVTGMPRVVAIAHSITDDDTPF